MEENTTNLEQTNLEQEEYYDEEQTKRIEEQLSALKPKGLAFYTVVIIDCILSFLLVLFRNFDFFGVPFLEYILIAICVISLVFLAIFGARYFKALKRLKKELQQYE